jgi:uncharacterized protein
VRCRIHADDGALSLSYGVADSSDVPLSSIARLRPLTEPDPTLARRSRVSDLRPWWIPSSRRKARPRSPLAGLCCAARTDEHPNATAYRRAADSFRARDFEALSSVVDADVVWHIPGRHPLAGDIVGRDALVTFMQKLPGLGFWLSQHDVFGNDEHVCALSTMGARRDTGDVETRVLSIFHFRDGKQVERWFYPDDAAAWDRIFTA